ncbi:2-C-methyl-D-erythritol 4-phosphate cytidylyltransferase [uncultured Sulfitobacter sp.]|uniref:2-C-methyl-D-erythritol 4-phosphate cytidylyltransferase n=1 Tax=uncultured Sulfitobacter sp. TaxID=191468 RepID=UPI00262B3AB2|nr:2-C-methyl-D-erythritol 4-phosphate cytidylyltransferase [uncultured Sulfitobacter sp.]
MRASVLIVAAGRGRRFGDETPKQYLPIAGVCSLRRCLETFLSVDAIAMVQPVIHADDADMFAAAIEGLDDSRILPPVLGGATRAKSVTCGLRALAANSPDCVLVHDAARPFVSQRIILDVLEELTQADAAFAALPVVDALWQTSDGAAINPVPRDGLWRAQTPQGFRFDPLLSAHLSYDGDAADDVEIARAMGIEVRIVMGASENFKITTPQDLERAEQVVANDATKEQAVIAHLPLHAGRG